jgi:hypothetical protein
VREFGYVPALTPADPDPEARVLELVRRRPGLGLSEWPDKRVNALLRVMKNNFVVARTHQPGRDCDHRLMPLPARHPLCVPALPI